MQLDPVFQPQAMGLAAQQVQVVVGEMAGVRLFHAMDGATLYCLVSISETYGGR